MPLHVSSTVVIIIRMLKLYYTASGIITPADGRPVHLYTGRPSTGVMIPDAVKYNFELLMMSTIVLETCRGIQ